jgi:isoquinoline 1-oxidoreductase alpha subunit
MASITFTLNGSPRTVSVPGDTPLLWVLRDTLAMTGTKFGCGHGFCGSCTILLDGDAIRSCMTPVSDVAGKSVLTIEGLSDEHRHPVQDAWIEADVPQCGYCQPGQILSAVALLKNTPNPTDEQIDRAMSDVLCRCGTYQRIRQAIHLAASKGGGQ